HLEALARLYGREICSGRFHLCIGDRLGKGDHQSRRQATRDGGAARTALIVSHLLDDVALRKAGEVGVFWAARPVRAMTKPTGEHVRLAAVGHDVRKRPMVARVPDRRDEPITELAPRITGRAVRHAHKITVVDWR